MIIYFTGTGNSRYVAEALADRLDEECVCANEWIKQKKKGVFRSERPWIFVFPVYVSTVAKVFADFIRNSEFSGNGKAYFVATCAKAMGSSPNVCRELCGEKKLEYMGAEMVQMPQNYILLFSMHEPEECRRRIAAAGEACDRISAAVADGKTLSLKLVSRAEYGMTRLVEKMYIGPLTKSKKFFATDECVGCGLCVKLCPLNNIELAGGTPRWRDNCTHCMACINCCPKQAVEYGKKTAGKRRYVCETYKPDR